MFTSQKSILRPRFISECARVSDPKLYNENILCKRTKFEFEKRVRCENVSKQKLS